VKRFKGLFIFLIFFPFFFSVSCSNHPPEIIQVFVQKNLSQNQESGSISEKISLFLHLQDEEGIDDIESIYCIHDDEELFWELGGDNWTTFEQDGEKWIGSNGLTAPGYDLLPGGIFRVVVIDAAGERNSTEIFLNSGQPGADIKYPSLRISGDNFIEISSPYEENTIWVFGPSNQPLGLFKTRENSVPVSSVISKGESVRDAAYYVYAYSNEYAYGLISGPFFAEE